MDTGGLQGWYLDPFRLHEARYFSSGQPTRLVRDGGTESYDEPPSGAWTPAPAVALADTHDTVSFGAASQSPAAYHPARYDGDSAPGQRRRSWPGIVAGTVLVAAAAVGAVVLVDPSRATAPGTGISPVAFVTQSARQTLAQRTADITLSASLQADNQSVVIRATGEMDSTTDAFLLDTKADVLGRSMTEDEIEVHGNLYYTLSTNGVATGLPGGRHWVQLPLPKQTSSAPDITGSDPLAALRYLAAQGASVRAIGTEVVGGVTCSGYVVTSPQAPRLTMTAWIDSQRLLRELSVQQATGAGSGTGASAGTGFSVAMTSFVMDFSNYGTPVRITPPPKSDTISFTALAKSLGPGSLDNLLGPASS